jgi:hypothetical protein
MKVIKIVILFVIISQYVFSATYQLPFAAYSLDIEDIDLDGDKDIIVGHKVAWEQTKPSISILENNGYGEFNLIDTTMTFCGYQENLFVEKVDSDEYPDIIALKSDFTTGEAERDVRIIYNNNGSFDNSVIRDFTINYTEPIRGLEMGDIDSDNDLDIMLFFNETAKWCYMLNNGDGEYSLPIYYDVSNPTDIAFGDLNGDSRGDVLLCGKNLDIWYNYETGLEYFNVSDSAYVSNIDIADVDNDGDNDIIGYVWGMMGTKKQVRIYSNDAIGNFELTYSKWVDQALSRTFVTDINGDEYPDIIFNCSYNYPNSEEEYTHTYIMYNNRDNTFSDPVKYQTYFGDSEYTSSLVSHVEDVDGNGYKDLITINSSFRSDNNLNILYQDSLGNFLETSQSGIESNNIPLKIELFQNYPNPFNNETEIKFSLDLSYDVELNIYNCKGEFVESLVKGRYYKGIHSLNYKTDGLTSGVYYYRLKADGIFVDSKKMLYVK